MFRQAGAKRLILNLRNWLEKNVTIETSITMPGILQDLFSIFPILKIVRHNLF